MSRPGWQRGFAVLLIIAVGFAGNLQLPFVQAVAWSRMYVAYRQQYTPAVALRITFSGQYPCKFCKMVAAAEKERNVLDGTLISSYRVLLPLPQVAVAEIAPPNSVQWRLPESHTRLPSVFAQPETPPPREA